ncbi:MAG: hypothetical protein C5B60_05265 [Chloroflexi bacterium]|nr:MAG: hypothetical protein C5B60_05265 [Chloroflexota bacterium]
MRRQIWTLAVVWAARVRALVATPGAATLLFFSCLYILTYQGRTNSYDGQSMFATTRALVEHGTLAISKVSANAFGTLGRDGLYYSKYGIGQSLAEMPLYLVGKLLGIGVRSKAAQVAESVAMLTNPLIMAASCAVFYGIIRRLGYQRGTAIRATIVLGIATSLWPYSKSDFSEPLLTLCLAVAVFCALQASCLLASKRAMASEGRCDLQRLDLCTGGALGIGVLTKDAAAIYVPVFLLYSLVTLPDLSWRDPRSLALVPRRLWLRRLIALLAPIIAAGILALLINILRFGSPLATGYAPGDRPFSGPVLDGLWGLLMSPRAGILFYDPLMFAGLLALPLLLRRQPLEALFPLGLFGGSLLFYAAYHSWSGGSAWGPRYLVPALPYLLFPLLALGCFGPAAASSAPTFLPEQDRRLRLLARGVTIVVVGISAGVQFLGVSVNYLMEDAYRLLSLHRFGNLISSLPASPLALSLWTLRLSLQYAFLHTFAPGYASTQYPFGPPSPIAPSMPESAGVYPLQFFWFTLTPAPLWAFAVGAVVLGGGMLLSARVLLRFARAESDGGDHAE